MDFDLYQEKALSTAVYPDAGTGSQSALSYAALGLGEAGEVQNKIKKILRGDYLHTSDTDWDAFEHSVILELGDILWYVTALANELGYSLDEVAFLNLNKVLKRKRAETIKGSGDER